MKTHISVDVLLLAALLAGARRRRVGAAQAERR